MTASQKHHACFLVEHLYNTTQEVAHCDVTKFLANALDSMHQYLASFPDEQFSPKVSLDDEGELEGIGFFDSKGKSRGFITVYRLDRDILEPEFEIFEKAAARPMSLLQAELSRIWS